MKHRVLFILHLPPPVHGAAMVGKYIHDSRLINSVFDSKFINLALAKDLDDIGKGGWTKLKNFVKRLIEITRMVREEKPTLCYVTPNAKGGAFYKDFIVVILLKFMGQRVVTHYHNKGVIVRQDKLLDNLLYTRFFKHLQVILLAEALYSDVSKYVARKDISICPNGIPTSLNTGNFVRKNAMCINLLFLSNMMEAKGVWDLLEACRLLKERNYTFQCHFVGKWSDIGQGVFKQIRIEKNIDDVTIAHGAKYDEEKEEYMQQADIFILPTHDECFPLVLLEAMEYNLPCISTNEGGISNIIEEGCTGYIVEKKNPQALAEKIAYLIDHPEIRQAMGEAGREKYLKEFTLERFEERMVEVLKNIIST